MQNTNPNIWYSAGLPTAAHAHQLYFWNNNGIAEMGVSGFHPVLGGTARTRNPILRLNSIVKGEPDATLYSQVAQQVVSARRSGILVMEWYETLGEVPPVTPPVIDDNLTTVRAPAIYVRVHYTTDGTDIIMHVSITDEYGFIMASNESMIESDITATPLFVNAGDVILVPIATTPIFNMASFDTTLFPVTGITLSPTYKPVKARWYGELPVNICPSQVSGIEVAIWKDTTGSYKISPTVPSDVACTLPTQTVTSGSIPGIASNTPCLNTLWWFLPQMGSTHFDGSLGLVNKIMAAANRGLLFYGERITNGQQTSGAYCAIVGAYTVNTYVTVAPSALTPNETNHVSCRVEISDHTGIPVLYATRSTRTTCTSTSATILYPDDYDRCVPGCGNILSILASHGLSAGINVTQGRGTIPTGTSLAAGVGRYVTQAVVGTSTSSAMVSITPNGVTIVNDGGLSLVMPFLGVPTFLHRNIASRVTALGYDTYYYPENSQLLAMGVSADLLATLTPAQQADLTSKTVWLISDDDTASILPYVSATSVILFTQASNTDLSQQAQTKPLYYYGPGEVTPTAEGTLTQHDMLSIDHSLTRSSSPLFNNTYPAVIDKVFAITSFTDKVFRVVRDSGTSKIGASLYKGFTGGTGQTIIKLQHTVSALATTNPRSISTGFFSYPEYAIPFTSSQVGELWASGDNPYEPTFTGVLPPNYRALWINWTTVSTTDLTVSYWNVDLPSPTLRTLVIPLAIGNIFDVLWLDGTVLITIEMTKNGSGANIAVYAGDNLIAVDTSGTLPWIPNGSMFAHVHGNALDVPETIFSAFEVSGGMYVSPLANPVNRDYIELQMEVITTPITSTTFSTMDLKPFTMYWDSVLRELYLPVMRRDDPTLPIQLAKTTFFKSLPTSYAPIIDLADHDSRAEHIYLSDGHGLGNIPVLDTAEVFTSDIIDADRLAIQYFWRRGTSYDTTVGPFIAMVVPGVTIPTSIGNKGGVGNVRIPQSTPIDRDNVTITGKTLTLSQRTSEPTRISFAFHTESSNDAVYSLRFTREQIGAWESTYITVSHLALYLMPTRPDYQLIQAGTNKTPIGYPQLHGARILFPKSPTQPIVIQVSDYRGFTWVTIPTTGNMELNDFDGKTNLTLEAVNVNGKMSITLFEAGIPKYKANLDIPFFNNGTIWVTYQGGLANSREVLSNMYFANVTAPKMVTYDRGIGLVYCSPTSDLHIHREVSAGSPDTLITLPITVKYGFGNIHLVNAMPYPITVIVNVTKEAIPTQRDNIGTYSIPPNTTRPIDMIYIHKGESIILTTQQSGLFTRIEILTQL